MTPIDYNNPNDMWLNNSDDQYKGMNDDQRLLAACLHAASFIVAIMVELLICALLGSCTTTKYVPVPEYHTDTLRIIKHERDSIYVEHRDSISTKERNDTVLIEKWHWRDRWRDLVVHDTLYQSKTDSIPYPVEVMKEIPAELTWWQQTRMHLGSMVLLLLGVGVVVWLIGKRPR